MTGWLSMHPIFTDRFSAIQNQSLHNCELYVRSPIRVIVHGFGSNLEVQLPKKTCCCLNLGDQNLGCARKTKEVDNDGIDYLSCGTKSPSQEPLERMFVMVRLCHSSDFGSL
jgi:hypothetical protein